jgi:hypothetical protein
VKWSGRAKVAAIEGNDDVGIQSFGEGADKVADLGHHKARNDQLEPPVLQEPNTAGVVSLGSVDGGVQRTSVNDRD